MIYMNLILRVSLFRCYVFQRHAVATMTKMRREK